MTDVSKSRYGGSKSKDKDETHEDMPDVDDDGNPLTIEAAQRIYHKNDNAFYIPKPRYKSVKEANNILSQGKMRIQ